MGNTIEPYKMQLDQQGFTIIDSVFTQEEITAINTYIETTKDHLQVTQTSKEVFAIRKLFSRLPGIKEKIFIQRIQTIIAQLFGLDYFIIKGLYFDKPAMSNWFVAYHQDLSIAAANKTGSPLFKGWTVKDDQFGVQPPVDILEAIYTLRIHLDDCTAQNGALHVIPGSHKRGIWPSRLTETDKADAVVCEVPAGGIMLMRPLLLHASYKTRVAASRRVVHIEFCNTALPGAVQWSEKEFIK